MCEYIQERGIESIPFEVGRVYPRIAYLSTPPKLFYQCLAAISSIVLA